MKFLFDDDAFSAQALRVGSCINHGGAELGELIVTAQEIPAGDEKSWWREWKAVAQRVEVLGRASLAAGHEVSGREALQRASNYYRTAEYFRRKDPARDPEVRELAASSRETFAAAMQLHDFEFELVSIPYENAELPGYLFLPDASGTPRPTVICTGGFDTMAEELYYHVAVAALSRGYNVLLFDGPGQGRVLREQGLRLRTDWEAVVTPVVDFVFTRQEIATDKIAIYGVSLGGYLAARSAAFDHRLAALIADGGVYDFSSSLDNAMPRFLIKWIDEGRHDRIVGQILRTAMAFDITTRWLLRHGAWALGVDSAADVPRALRQYTLDGVADKITAPTLLLEAENDQGIAKGEAARAARALVNAASVTHIALLSREGAGEHCHQGAFTRKQQVVFDWLDKTLMKDEEA